MLLPFLVPRPSFPASNKQIPLPLPSNSNSNSHSQSSPLCEAVCRHRHLLSQTRAIAGTTIAASVAFCSLLASTRSITPIRLPSSLPLLSKFNPHLPPQLPSTPSIPGGTPIAGSLAFWSLLASTRSIAPIRLSSFSDGRINPDICHLERASGVSYLSLSWRTLLSRLQESRNLIKTRLGCAKAPTAYSKSRNKPATRSTYGYNRRDG
jgi:hypothetical protein